MSRTNAKLTVAMNIPMATNETESPIESAAGPHFRSDAAAPRTIGRMGSTQGDNTDSMPAASASTRLPSVIHPGSSQHLVQQCGNRLAVGVSDRSALLGRALERDQRGLLLCSEPTNQILLAVEIDRKINQILELGIGHQLGEDRRLRLADRTP